MATTAVADDGKLAHYGVQLLLTNQFVAAKKLFDDKAAVDPEVALLHSFLSYGNAISSYSESDLKACVESCKRAAAIGEKLEKTGKKDNNLGSRIQGLLIQADTDLLTACIQLVEENYVKMMWNMRKSYNNYQEAQKYLEKYSGNQKAELSGWVKYGTGLFNLLLSQLPPSVMSIAEMIGFEGDRDVGMKLLTECQQGASFNAPFAALLMLVYYLTIAPLTGDVVPGGMEHAKRLIDWSHERYPNGAFFALMESRYFRAINDPRKAIEVADAASKLVSELPSIELIFHYQKAWCAFFLLSWQESAEEFDKLLHSTPGGDYQPPGAPRAIDKSNGATQMEPTQASAQGSYAYQIGLCYAMVGDWHRARWYMASVNTWLKKAGGTPKEIDLYAKHKAEEFILRKRNSVEDAYLDICDLLDAWNGWSQMNRPSLDAAQAKLVEIRDKVKAGQLSLEPEDAVRLEVAFASILSTKHEYRAAYDILNPLATSKKELLKSSRCKKSGLNSFFYFQLAEACLNIGDIAAAKEWHKKSAKTTGFDLYKQLQIRLHTLKAKIKEKERK